ncbi:hypothetical protein A2661_00395 [Candidatus Giovannonibacteria bacterium RIFCSPHIGHO2_01_FULL_45_24]|uniref:Amidinotransferase n=1 Tax=Candidatus Giovannonibacteria bacterium RIFCSPLOWO2_01_FULL_46_32 TaxID=1798353 RepID=A0A1F5XGN9_9BACT|nr:MAG: hypothetical protein A2661_00395 [Candidatus Giovannonibacteria bacterium RIFCSPHIGHO2_01_FULL_45_24]OGF87037.1 MAG: hypothetical protein A3B19_01235 [Candidatus Giovannonibacteria bacterium RIFCSPLOWO2_01_FULL_46_32]
MKINSHNEWDKLREIVVGRGEGQAPLLFTAPGQISEDLLKKANRLAREASPKWLIDEINEDLEGLSNTLKSFGIKVYRPETSHVNSFFATPYFRAAGDYCYNMRDLHLVVGNTVIESPSQEKHRYFEAFGLYDIWYEYFKEGFRWIAGPKPRLAGNHMIIYYDGEKNEYEDGQKFIKLTEDEILFEAANTVRMGKDLLYLVSRSGNNLGAKWLQSVLGNEYRVHTTEKIYRSSHIDSTVLALRPGLVLLNATRVSPETCPSVLNSWEKIYFTDIVPAPESTVKFHKDVRKKVHKELASLGIQSSLDSMASDWIGMNILSVDLNTVIVDEWQVPLINLLKKHKITPVPIRFRHSYYMGGIHCSTLDTVRESKLESYFG